MSVDLERVMLVEDDPDIRAVAKVALEIVGGFSVCACESGAQALESIAGFDPQIVLLDVMMPEMDGPAVLAKLRARQETETVPVIFLTAKARTEEMQQLAGLGALGIIAKPFDPMTLADQVKALWKRSAG